MALVRNVAAWRPTVTPICAMAVFGLSLWVGSSPTGTQLAVLGIIAWLAIFAAAYRRPRAALLGYVAALPFLPAWAGLTLPALQTFTVAHYLGSALLGAALLSVLLRERGRPFEGHLDWMMLLYLSNLIVAIQVMRLNATATGAVRGAAYLSLSYFLAAYLVSRFARDPRWTRQLLRAILFASLFSSLLALYEFATRVNPFTLLPLPVLQSGDWLGGEGIFAADRYGLWRVVGPFGKQIDAGWYYGLILVLMLGGLSYLHYDNRPIRCACALLLLCAGLIAAVSGTPLISTLLGLAVFALLRPRQAASKQVLIAAAAVLVLAVVLPWGQDIREVVGAFLQLDTPAYLDAGIQGNTAARLDVYPLLWPTVLANPLLGYGDFVRAGFTNIVRDVTSRYMVEALNGGLPGLLTFLLPLIWAGRCALYTWRNSSDPAMKALAAAVFAGLVQCAAMYATKYEGQIVGTFYWTLIGLACALPSHLPLRLPTHHTAKTTVASTGQQG